MSASPSQPPPPMCPLCPNSKADFSNPQILKTHNLTRHNLVYKSTVDVGAARKVELIVHRPNPTGSLACPSPRCSSKATLGHNLKAHIEHCEAARTDLGGVKKSKPPVQPPPSASTSSVPRPPSSLPNSSLPNFKRKEAPSTSSPYSNHHTSSSQQRSASPSADGQQRKRARVSLAAARSTEPETEMEVDANEPTDDTVDPKWYTLEMGSELMWAVVNLKDKNGIPLASEFFVYPDFDVYIDYLSVIPDAFTLKDVQDHLDIGNHASLYYVKRYIDRCFKQARDYFSPEHRLHKAAVELTAIVKQTYDYLPFAADASPSPTALIYGKPTPFVVRPPRPFTDEGFDHLVQFVADKIHRTNALLNKRSIHGFPPDFFDELASQDIPSSTWYLFYVKATKSFRSTTMPMTKAIRLALTKLQGDANAGGQDAAAVAPVGGGGPAAAAPAAGPSAPAAPPPMFGSPKPRPPPVASNAATAPSSRPLHPPAVPSTSTPSSKAPNKVSSASSSSSDSIPPPSLVTLTPNAFGAAPTAKQVGWLSGLLTSAIAEASPTSGPSNATPPPDRIPIVHRTPQPFPGLSSYSPSDAPSPPSELAAPLPPPSPAPSRPAPSILTVNESQPEADVLPPIVNEEPASVVDEAQAPVETENPPRAPSPSPPPPSAQPVPPSSTPMDTSETVPIASPKDDGQDALDELLLLSQGAASYGTDTSDDGDDDGLDLTQMSHEEWLAHLETKGPPRPSTSASTPSPIPTLAANAASAPPRPALITTETTTLRLENTRLTTRNSELKTCLDDLSAKMKKREEEHASEIQALHAALAAKDTQLAVARKEKEDAEVDWMARRVKLEQEKVALMSKWKDKEAEEARKAEERRAALAALMRTL